MPNKLFIIDGHALIFKMFYAFMRAPMKNSKGMDTSILYGFTKYILELIAREQPTHFAVAFDPPGGTFRNKLYADYKANRPPTPPLVISALEPLQELCHALNIPTLMVSGYEADDVIGTVAKRLASEDFEVCMVTPDKDYGQLIDTYIKQIKPGKAGGEDEILDKAAVCAKYGIQDPSQVIEMLTICGDTADNVPGVKGVGEVGASKLISKFGTVKGIYAALDQLSEKQRAMFEAAKEHITLSHELVTIKTDVPVEVDVDEMRLNICHSEEIEKLFDLYEFNSLFKYIGGRRGEAPAPQTIEMESIDRESFISKARKAGRFAVLTDGQGEDRFAAAERVTVAVENYVFEGTPEALKQLLEDEGLTKCGYEIKESLHALEGAGITLGGRLLDAELMHYLIDPERSHKLSELVREYVGASIDEDEESQDELSLFETEKPSRSRVKEAAAVYELCSKLAEEAEKRSLSVLYDNVEEPLVRVLARMERNGVRVDLQRMAEFAGDLRKEMNAIEAEVRTLGDCPELNVSSPKQVGELLFDKLCLDPKAKKKGSLERYSTDEATLQAISDRHPIVGKILEFRAVKKLLSTYIEPFPSFVHSSDGKIHTTFNQALTATGRLSSSSPNLQNIPIRTERGKEIRKAFVPSFPGGLIMSADYSQIELRIMAHLCGDEHLVSAFNAGEDVHKATAAKIYGTALSEITSEQRRTAKMVNFGIMYGISSFGLAQRLDVSRAEAKRIIEDYFAAFPSIQTFISETVEKARRVGYAETMFGRRRYLPDILSKNANLRNFAERNAVNAPIQGTSADIIKIAMVGVDRRMAESGMRSKMILQIHDELVFDTLPEEAEDLKALVVEEMENVITLRVPLTVECNYGSNWLEAH